MACGGEAVGEATAKGHSHPLHKPAPVPENDEERLEVLHSLSLLDTEPEEAFDRITRATSATLKFPITLVSLVDTKRQWFKSTVGLGVKETHRDLAICSHVVYKGDTDCLVVSDTWQDDRFKYSDLVLGDPKIRAYAGAPLMYQRDGKTFKLGTLCVIDATPRDVSSEELSLLETMAKLVIAEIEIREKNLKPALNRSVKVHLFPRRKAGDQVFPEKGRLPVKVDRETIESMYGLPQPDAARALGISLTSLKQVCRKLGVLRWPYQRLNYSPASIGAERPASSGGGASGTGAHRPGSAGSAPAGRASCMVTGQLSLHASTLHILGLSSGLERLFEDAPFPVVGQQLDHILLPGSGRYTLTTLREICQSVAEGESREHEPLEGHVLVYRQQKQQVPVECFECRLHPRVEASELAVGRMTVDVEVEAAYSLSPVLPMQMSSAEIQALLSKSGQFSVDDLRSQTDYAAVSAKTSVASGLPDLWSRWENQVRALAAEVPPPPGSPPPGESSSERQHPSIDCMKLLKKLEPRSGMRVIQNCSRLLLVPEVHGNDLAVNCHVRFATPRDDQYAKNPFGAIADWHPSEGLLLGLAGTPVICNGSLQFSPSVGQFTCCAFWDQETASLHIHVKRMRNLDSKLLVYQTEDTVVRERQGRNVIEVEGTILGGLGPEAEEPFHYRVCLGQVPLPDTKQLKPK